MIDSDANRVPVMAPVSEVKIAVSVDAAMYKHYRLTLLVTHDCNMRCSYCYAGAKTARSMPEWVGRRAIERALASLEPGGTLALGFFGGEPLLEAELVTRLAAFARTTTQQCGLGLSIPITTNGTIHGPAAWHLMAAGDVEIAISFDGLPELHDRHRRFANGRVSSAAVLRTIRLLIDAGRPVRVEMVVRPDTVDRLDEMIEYASGIGVRQIDLNLDLWAEWTADDAAALDFAIGRAARVWASGLPHLGVNWFDEKAAAVSGIETAGAGRCGFGNGEIAVTPAGRLYPCERLVGDDRATNPMRLRGHVSRGADFLGMPAPAGRSAHACTACSALSLCNTFCRCSNYVRTGDVSRPDRLLCLWNQACLRETANALSGLRTPAAALRA